jgi:hypothetical protein
MKSCEFAVRHGLSPVESGTYIGGYRQLSVHRVGFYPIHLDKPAVPDKLDRVANRQSNQVLGRASPRT